MSVLDDLTSAQLRIIDLAIQGLQNKEIARAIGISHRTVENQIARAKQQTGIKRWLPLLIAVDRAKRGAPGGATDAAPARATSVDAPHSHLLEVA